MKRAKLVIVDDEPPRLVPVDAPEGRIAYRDERTGRVITSQDGVSWEGTNEVAPSCATCKWAEETTEREIGVRLHDLTCTRTHVHSALFGNHEGVNTQVAPDFGCVQWEGK